MQVLRVILDGLQMTDRQKSAAIMAMISYANELADAEAAAMRERAAKLVDEDKRMTRDPEVKGDLFELAAAIRALSATGEVGRG